MNLLDFFTGSKKYKPAKDGIIISCYFNPTHSPYRKKVFMQYYETIKHLNHRIIECIHGEDETELFDIVNHDNLELVYSKSILWHKESLLNKLIFKLPDTIKYVFWIDADVLFTNKNWMVDGCKKLERYKVIQPFETCFHLSKDEVAPPLFHQEMSKSSDFSIKELSKYGIWRSFCSVAVNNHEYHINNDYDLHGHVGFAWGARLDYLKSIGGLYDKALIGGADHIMAHAFAAQIPCECITKSFGNTDDIRNWSKKAFIYNDIGVNYVNGDLYHLWHGDIKKREYLKRIQEFEPLNRRITTRDENGLFITTDDSYVMNYLINREVTNMIVNDNSNIETPTIDPGEFGGGEFGGSGAGEEWTDNPTENFS